MQKARLTRLQNEYIVTTTIQSLPFYFPPIHTQTITNMNSKRNKANKRQDIQDYPFTFINIESRL